jgi:hypothetical protein
MLLRNYKETVWPDLEGQNFKFCHSGQNFFLKARIKSLPKEECDAKRNKILEKLKR